MMRCLNADCGEELEDDEKFCPECGKIVRQPEHPVTNNDVIMQCPQCGAQRKYGKKGLSKFCSQCRFNYTATESLYSSGTDKNSELAVTQTNSRTDQMSEMDRPPEYSETEQYPYKRACYSGGHHHYGYHEGSPPPGRKTKPLPPIETIQRELEEYTPRKLTESVCVEDTQLHTHLDFQLHSISVATLRPARSLPSIPTSDYTLEGDNEKEINVYAEEDEWSSDDEEMYRERIEQKLAESKDSTGTDGESTSQQTRAAARPTKSQSEQGATAAAKDKDPYPECETVTVFKEYYSKVSTIDNNEDLSRKLFQADREKHLPELSSTMFRKIVSLKTRMRFDREDEEKGIVRELKKYGFNKRQLGIIKEMSEFIKHNHSSLNKMFKQTGVGEIGIKEVPQSPPPLERKKRTITFRVMLSSQFVDYFEKRNIKPTVELRSEIRAWRRHIGMTKVGGIWQGEMEVPITTESDLLIYNYVVHDGVNLTRDNWEFLDKNKTTHKHINRVLDIGGGEDDMIVFDGVALPSYFSDVWKKTVKDLPQSQQNYEIKQQEKERGLKAMFPTWCADKPDKDYVAELVTWFDDIRLRHRDIALRFPNYFGESVPQFSREIVGREIDKVFSIVVGECLDSHIESLKTCTHPWQAVASMLGLVCLSSLKYDRRVSVIEVHKEKYLHVINSTTEKLFELMQGGKERQAAAHNTLNKAGGFAELHEALGGDESFLRKLTESLLEAVKLIGSSYWSCDEWITLLPYIFVMEKYLTADNRGDNFSEPLWWGNARITNEIKSLQAQSHKRREDWKKWLRWLSLFFVDVPILPYTYLSMLTTTQFINLLNNANEIPAIRSLLLDGVVAKASLLISNSRGHFHNKILGIIRGLLDFLRKTAMYSKRSVTTNKFCMDISVFFLAMLRDRATSQIAEGGVHEAVQLALTLSQDYFTSLEHQVKTGGTARGKTDTKAADKAVDLSSIFEQLCLPFVTLVNDIHSVLSNVNWRKASLHKDTLGYGDRVSGSIYGRRMAEVPKEEIECWSDLFRCKVQHTKMQNWWVDLLRHAFGSRLNEVAQKDPVSIIDLYCKYELSVPAMNQTVADAAFSRADKLIMIKGGSKFITGGTTNKITKLVDQAVNKAWDTDDERPMTIAKNMLKWGNFFSVWSFYESLDEEQRGILSPTSRSKLIKSFAALETIIDSILNGSVNFSDFTYLCQHQDRVMELCKVSPQLKNHADHISEIFEKREAQRKSSVDFHCLVSELWSSCNEIVEERDAISRWMKLPDTEKDFAQSFDAVTNEIVCDLIPQSVREILLPFKNTKQRIIFSKEFQNRMRASRSKGPFAGVVTLFKDSMNNFTEISNTLRTGRLSIAMFEKVYRIYFDNELQVLLDELGYIIQDKAVLEQRTEQIIICANLDVYHSGAKLMLDMKKLYGLTGDFKDMEHILASKDKKLELREITQRLVDSADSIKDITNEMISAVRAFKDCEVFVKWAREEVPKSDISTFVDLASGTLDEDDEAAQKTRYLINALTGYSPLIYDFNPDDQVNFKQFMSYCKEVWRAHSENPTLEKNLRYTASNLQWLKKVKSHFGNVELGSIAQAHVINQRGVYKIGNIHGFSNQFKTLDDVILLTCEVTEVVMSHSGDPVHKKSTKRYTYSDIKDLQSRLTLIAVDKQEENKKTITEFQKMRDEVENLAQAYLEIRKEGCIQFDDLLIKIDCDEAQPASIKVKFQAIKEQYIGRRAENSSTIEHCTDLCDFLRECVKKWREIMVEKRRQHGELNFFTTEQIVELRKELGQFIQSSKADILSKSLPLLAMIHPVTSAQLHALIEKSASTGQAPPQITSQPPVMEYERMNSIQQDLVDEVWLYAEAENLMEKYSEFSKEAVVEAVCVKDFDRSEDFVQWIVHKLNSEDKSDGDKTTNDVMKAITTSSTSKSGTLKEQLSQLWDNFVEMTDQTIKDFLSVTHLGNVLNQLKDMRVKKTTARKLPAWLARGQPALIPVSQKVTYQLALSIYECDADYTYPTRNEVIVCNKTTTREQVDLFLSRSFSDSHSVYTMVNCHLLDYEACKLIEHRVSRQREEGNNQYGLVFIYPEEVKDAKIRSYLDKYLVKSAEITDKERIVQYVLRMLKVPPDVEHTCGCVDPDRSMARLIRSSRAGVGKSYQKSRLTDRLVNFPELADCPDITIPIYKTINTDAVIHRLRADLGSGYGAKSYHAVHFDIAHEVEQGVDELLFNLIILRSIVNSEGVVWQAQHTQYYIIECMPHVRKGRGCAHEVLDLLPTISCIAPEDALTYYKNPETAPAGGFIGFDEDVLMQKQWQTVLKFLDCHRKKDPNFDPSEEEFTDQRDALELLIGNCGLKNPTWSELRHYVYFLSSQLFKIEASSFTSLAVVEDMPGFRKFVVNFMLRMAQDFATRSLKIAEETPGLEQTEPSVDVTGEANEDELLLDKLTMKRSWESDNHPYLFFNEDGATVTPLGFVVKTESLARPSSLIDSQTQEVILKDCISRDLKRALDQTNLDMSENFNAVGRQRQIYKLRCIMVKDVQLWRKPTYKRVDGSYYKYKHYMFEQNDDPDSSYVLTLDNAKKILAIHQRLKVNIPVIIMGETGCGKTRLIEFMSKLQVPTELRDELKTMIIVKIHGGTTEDDIINSVKDAQKLAIRNQERCAEYAKEYLSEEAPLVYTMLFLDEANTTDSIGLVKEILCDRRMRGIPLEENTGLKIIAACNPYKRHSPAMIEKLKKAGLGYNVSDKDTKDKFGQIPMRHLVYRVQPLPQSLLPLVWDFGSLPCGDESAHDRNDLPRDAESQYIRQMLVKSNHKGRAMEPPGLNFAHRTATCAKVLSMTQYFMRKQKDECSFVSLRDIQRLLDVSHWFYNQRENLFPAMDKLWDKRHATVDVTVEPPEEDAEEEEGEEPKQREPSWKLNPEQFRERFREDDPSRCLLLALGVCYLARLEQDTREKYADYLSQQLQYVIGARDNDNTMGKQFLFEQIELCQDTLIEQVIDKEHHKNIAKNKALKENVFMMIVCIENRIPLFLVGKPGSSKSLSKSLVDNATKGRTSKLGSVFSQMKKTHMVSFQCSRHATASGIVAVFNYCANYQNGLDLSKNVSVVVLDEVGLAEDSENMPLKSLHPLLEDGCEGNRKAEPWMKCAFIGISNWALDPAKMNRGIFVQRGTPKDNELEQIAKEICFEDGIPENLGRYISDLALGYLAICDTQKPEMRQLTEFYGLRDFYSLMKMVVNFSTRSEGGLTSAQLEHSIKRNFGGFDTDHFNPMDVFREKLHNLETLPTYDEDRGTAPPTDPMGLIKSSLAANVPQLQEMESRYLLILTESLSVLPIILDEFTRSQEQTPEIIFGSRFSDDVSYTQICYNINRIKTCMGMGRPVILLNLDDLYESLYDLLNQYFSIWDGRKYVHVGLGNHRVKSYVHDKFRLVVIADKNKVHTQFPIPLINRLEKHYVSATSLLDPDQKEDNNKVNYQKDVKQRLESWAKKFVRPDTRFRNVCPSHCDGCDEVLDQPYKLPCLSHFVGACCREAMFSERIPRECPVESCDRREISNEYLWEVDKAALANRQYFENTAVQTVFIGYSSEATALCVRRATDDIISVQREEEEVDQSQIEDKVYERAKFHLLQCATGESVLRLDKTEIYSESKSLQEMYMDQQFHETLHDCLVHQLPVSPGNQSYEPIFLQVTSFAELMNPKDVDIMTTNLHADGFHTDIRNIYLKQFVKQDQFTDAVRLFYEKKIGDTIKILLVQCESANENTELLDSVRYIIQRESEAVKTNTHTVLLLNLPRGHTFSGYQGGKWSCLHIDDPRSPVIKLPSLSKCMQLSPSQIISKLIHSLKLEEDSVYESDKTESYDYLLPFIIQCLPAAVSTIQTSQQYDRVSYIKELMLRNRDFLRPFLRHVHDLLRAQDEYNPGHWVKTDAAKASNMKQSETLRHALEDSLERFIIPSLAAVISFTDVQMNLQLLTTNSPLYPLWIDLFSQAHKLGLNFDDLTTRSASSGPAISKLPSMYSIAEISQGQQNFRLQFPFSWVVKETIDKIIRASSDSIADLVDDDGLIEQYKLTPIGKLLCDTRYDRLGSQMIDSYLTDFVYMSHPCVNTTEHRIACEAIVQHIKSNGINQVRLIHIHQAYSELKLTMDNLSAVMSLTVHYRTNPITSQALKAITTDKPCEVRVLECLLNHLTDIKLPELLPDPERWVNLVMMCDRVMEQITSTHSNQEYLNVCSNLWTRLIFKRLYVEHVIIPSPINPERGQRKAYKLLSLIKGLRGTEFQTYEYFEKVVNGLRGIVGEGVRTLYGDCPTRCPICNRPLDSPVRLTCGHLLCDVCVTEIQTCSQDSCDLLIPTDYTYQPQHDQIDEVAYQEFIRLRTRLNKFFMRFVSELVFLSEPSTEVITWLAECVTFRGGTRRFSIFNCEDVVDPDPVLRSFLLKLLLKCKASQRVREYLDKIVTQPNVTEADRQQTMILLMDCHKDLSEKTYGISELSAALSAHTLLISALHTNPSVELLCRLADMQSVLSNTIDLLVDQSEYRTEAHLRLTETLQVFLEKAHEANNPQPGYMVVRQLFSTSGESYVKDLINTPQTYLVPGDVKEALESFVVPDVLSVYGGDMYLTAKEAFNKLITESASSGESFDKAFNDFKQSCPDPGLMLHVLFNRVTRSFTQATPLLSSVLQAVRTGFERWTFTEKRYLKMLVYEGQLPQQLEINQSKGIHLTMLVLHLFSGTRNKHPAGIIHPLHELIETPSKAMARFLPTMADNQFEVYQEAIRKALQAPNENPVAYRCPNGHPYVIGDCGRPYYLAHCHECGAQIGGRGHRAAAGNQTLGLDQPLDDQDKSKKGHILGRHTSRHGAAPERELSSLSCAVLRCITHLCLLTAALSEKRQVFDVIRPALVRDDDVLPFLDAHIQLDLQHISQCCGESVDDCLLLLHDVIHNFNTADHTPGEEKIVLDNIKKRQQWESEFDKRFIRPVFDNQEDCFKAINSQLKTSEAVDLNQILSTENKPLDNENTLSSPGLWEYRRPLTLPAVQNLLHSSIKGCPHLKLLVENRDRLRALQYLPDILTLLQSINNKYHSHYSRLEVHRLSMQRFCDTAIQEIPNIRSLVDSFIQAWNIMVSSTNKGVSADLGGGVTIESRLSEFLLDKHRLSTGISHGAHKLISFLVETHNAMLSEIGEDQISTAPLTEVSSTNLIYLRDNQSIIELIQSHSEYEVRGSSSVPSYNWPAVENEVIHKYISNKPRILYSRQYMPVYVYQEDFNLHNQLQTIEESQIPLTTEQQNSITSALVMRIPILTQHLKCLQIVINFLSVLPRVEGDNSLADYMKATFGRDISYLTEGIMLKHVRDVWLLIKYTQADLLMRHKQAPYDDTSGEYRADLYPDLRAEVNDLCRYGSAKTQLLSRVLFEFVLLKLNRAATSQTPSNAEIPLMKALAEHVYLMYGEEGIEITNQLPNLPDTLLVSHAYKAWCYIWTRLTTPVL